MEKFIVKIDGFPRRIIVANDEKYAAEAYCETNKIYDKLLEDGDEEYVSVYDRKWRETEFRVEINDVSLELDFIKLKGPRMEKFKVSAKGYPTIEIEADDPVEAAWEYCEKCQMDEQMEEKGKNYEYVYARHEAGEQTICKAEIPGEGFAITELLEVPNDVQ